MALIHNNKDGLQETADLLWKYADQAGLRINARNNEIMAIIAKNTSQRPYTKEGTVEITVEGSPVHEHVTSQWLHLFGCDHF